MMVSAPISWRLVLASLVLMALGATVPLALDAPIAQPAQGNRGGEQAERQGLDAQEREALRRELRERGRSGSNKPPVAGRDGGGKDAQRSGGSKLSADEREELRRQLREASRRKD